MYLISSSHSVPKLRYRPTTLVIKTDTKSFKQTFDCSKCMYNECLTNIYTKFNFPTMSRSKNWAPH